MKKKSPDRIGLSLHKELVPHVLEKAPVLEMNPNEFVNACVEECVNGMMVKDDPGSGAPGIVSEYRSRKGMNQQPESHRLGGADYALLRSLEEVIFDLNLAKQCVLAGAKSGGVLTPAVVELLQKYREIRTTLLAQAALAGGNLTYPAPRADM